MKKIFYKNHSRILFWLGILLFVSELWKQLVINCVLKPSGDGYCWWYFPFQLCSTPMYVCLLLGLSESKCRSVRWEDRGKSPEGCRNWSDLRDALLTYLAVYGLLGGVFAFFDTSGFTELGFLPLTVHSWVWHILLILMGLLAGFSVFTPDFTGATLLYLGGCGIAEGINLAAGEKAVINMFYINPRYKMAQVCFSEIALYAGNGWGILCYILAIIVGAAFLYIGLLVVRGK